MEKRNILNNKIIGSIASLGSATLVNSILAFLLGIINRDQLGPKLYGYWLTISLIFTFVPIFQLGTLNAMNREIPFYLARRDTKRAQEIKEDVFSFIFTIPLLLVIILFLASGILLFTGIRFEYKIGMVFATIIAFATYMSSYVEAYYKSAQDFHKVSKLISIKSISQSVITVVLVYLIGYIGLYLGMLFSLLIEVFVARDIFPKYKKEHNTAEYKQLIRTGFPIMVVGLVWSIMIATDRMIISIFMTPEDLGNYGVGMLVFNTMMLLPQVIGQVFYPKMVELISQKKIPEIKRFYLRINKILAIVMLFIVIIGYFLLPYFIDWFLPGYHNGIKTAQILLLGIYPLTMVGMCANYFNSTNNQKIYLMIQIISIVINIVVSTSFLFVDKTITAVALGTSLSFTVYSILMNTFFWVKIRKLS